jgi:DNA-binding response OmpR family regulator
MSVEKSGDRIELTVTEYNLLSFLAANPGVVYSREELLQDVWHNSYQSRSTINVHVTKLRAKLEDDPSKPKYIHTVWGAGYKAEVAGA